ncbi:unnamed protein product [Echinostoma caproni]|uniref:SH2 domain-containing protein n=1 Tax=Echinostoma caproni TaxID=27848 RepID=A0A183ALI9_9TREM|nr:unnamed protein product [Echinostoma caproni]
MIRHFRKLNQTSAQIGNISASEAVNLAERCEKRLHTILVDLDAQLAERRQQPKKKLSTLSQEPSRGLSETRTDLANTNGNHSRLNPPQLIEHNYENARGLWPRVRRAFSDKRSNPVEPKVTDNLQPHSYRNSVPIGRYLVTPYYDDDLEESSGIQAVPLGSKAEKLILMKNPLQELISCVTAGTISAAVRRNSRRQTVGAVTAALQNTLPKDKQKHLSESLKSYEKLTVASVLRKEDISFQYIDVTGIDSMTHSHTTQSHSALSNQRQENNKAEVADAPKDLKNPKIVEKRINRMKTFPARQFPFVRLQRRRSEPAAHNFLVIPSAYTNNEVPLTKPKVEDSESLYDCQPHSAEMGISVLSPNCIPSGVGDTYIAQASTRHSKSLSGSMLVTEQDEHAQYDNCSVPSTTTRALSQSLAVSGENNASQTLCRLSLPPIKKNDKYATNVKNFKEFATREEYPNLQCEISEATTYSVPSQYIKNESQLSETAKSVFERKEMRTFYVPSTVFVETEALPNRVKDLTEMSHLVFLDEAGNPCFDI